MVTDDPAALVERTEGPAVSVRRSAAIARTTARWRPGARLLLAFAIGVLLAGCYETDQEIITIDRAVQIPGLPGEFDDGDGGSKTISPVPFANEYRFAQTSSEGETSYGTLRAIPIVGDIYLVQAQYDGEATYILVFYEFTTHAGRKLKELEPDEPVEHLAAQYGVTIELDEWGVGFLYGSRSDILAFLLAHRGIRFL